MAVPEEPKRKHHHLFKSITTDQYGHFDLDGLAPGKYRLFSWDGVEKDEWEDTDFLKEYEEKGVTIDLKDSATKSDQVEIDSGEKLGRDVNRTCSSMLMGPSASQQS